MTTPLAILLIDDAVSTVIVNGIPCSTETIWSPEILLAFRPSSITASIFIITVMTLTLPTTYTFIRTGMPFKRLFGLMVELILSPPYILLDLSLLIVFSSPVDKWLEGYGFRVVFSPVGIAMVRIPVNLPYTIRLIHAVFKAFDQRLEFTARTLEASPWEYFLTILFPLCRGNLISAFTPTWSRALGEFGATLMLMGATRFKTETPLGSIYLSILAGNNPTTAAITILMLLTSGCTLFLARFMGKSRYQYEQQVGRQINYTKCRDLNEKGR